jgi:hypothetical protein
MYIDIAYRRYLPVRCSPMNKGRLQENDGPAAQGDRKSVDCQGFGFEGRPRLDSFIFSRVSSE